MRERGFSLVEVCVVIAIVGILLSIAVLNWNQMQTKSAVESQIKTLHADLMQVRLNALATKRSRSVVISGQVYKAYSSQVVTSSALETKQLRFPVVWDTAGTLTFDTQGLIQDLADGAGRYLCIVPTGSLTVINSAAVDSIVFSQAQQNMGKRTGVVCDGANIDRK